MHAHTALLLDEFGQPLSHRLQNALLPLGARLRREYPALIDECVVTEVLEEAGRRIAAREERRGRLDNLAGYGWVVARRMAALRVRCGEWAVANATLSREASDVALRDLPAGYATSEQIFNELLCKELVAQLEPTEQAIAKARQAGHSNDDIARGCGLSRRTLHNTWRRLKRKMVQQGVALRAGRAVRKKTPAR